ncbi:hypothetical protein V9K67_26715, partial [Paraflavisolibacter sp. H34]|uniref:hypothetical protein n=1 Tax=Huijunlia imazamoxiresistens TaxID=3127457 RepID=UPI00301A0F9B
PHRKEQPPLFVWRAAKIQAHPLQAKLFFSFLTFSCSCQQSIPLSGNYRIRQQAYYFNHVTPCYSVSFHKTTFCRYANSCLMINP